MDIKLRNIGNIADNKNELGGEDVAFLHVVLTQCGLPRNPTKERIFTRTNGAASLRLEAGSWWNGLAWEEMPLPSGTRPRLVLVHACSEAVRTRSPVVELEDSIRAFLRRLRIDTGGKTMKAFRLQMLALACARLTIGYRAAEGNIVNLKVDPVEKFEAWLQAEDNGQRALWPGELTLSEPFFRSLLEYAVPLDQGAIAELQNSALALDIYCWLAHRLCRINRPAGVALSWAALRAQFGQEYRVDKDFRRELLRALQRALSAYPEAKVERMRGGLRLKPSLPPVKRKGHLVALPKPATLAKPPEPRAWVSEEALERVRGVAPGWDRQALLAKYQAWSKGREAPKDIDKAFFGWAKKFTKGKPPS